MLALVLEVSRETGSASVFFAGALCLAVGLVLGRWSWGRRSASDRDTADEDRRASERERLSNLSHELRTPLNGISGMTHFLVHSNLDQEQQECVQTIQSCVDSLLGMVSDVLDHSKLEAGKLVIEHVDFCLETLLEEAFDVFCAEACRDGIELVLETPGDASLLFRGDPTRLRQVVLNLLSNAVKFTPTGGRVELALECHEGPGETVRTCVSVLDTGPGIPEEKYSQLFQAFSQLETSTTREFGGTGLGLAISRGLVESMGGRIECESRVGEGTTFRVHLDLERQKNLTARSRSMDLEGMEVIVVEPCESAARILVSRLEAWNATVHHFESATEAESSLRTRNADALLVAESLKTAGVAGLQSQLQSLAVGEGPRLCLMRARGEGREEADGWQEPDAVLLKPIKRDSLMATMLALRTASESGAPTPVTPAAPAPAAALPAELEEEFSLEDTRYRRVVRILVVDDNALNRRIAEKMLARIGYQTSSACDGQEAVDAVQRSPFDLILMDLQMPVMDGLDATRCIRSREGDGRRTPIVALTANGAEEAQEMCLEAGMDDFLSKPVTGENLARIISRWVLQVSS